MNTDKTIFITGATGNQGGAVADKLSRNGFTVKALTRNPASANAARLQTLGATIVSGDLNDPATYRDHLKEVDGVFSVQTFKNGIEREVTQGTTLATVAKEMGVKHFIYSSILSADSHSGVSLMDSKFKIENHIRSLNLPFTIIRPASLYENFLIPQVRKNILKGRLIQPVNGVKVQQYISAQDIGKAVLTILRNPESYLNQTLPLAVEQMSVLEVTKTFSRVLGRRVAYKKMPMFLARLLMGKHLSELFHWVNEQSAFDAHDVEITRLEIPDFITLEGWIKLNFNRQSFLK